jgi:hypothetical protein
MLLLYVFVVCLNISDYVASHDGRVLYGEFEQKVQTTIAQFERMVCPFFLRERGNPQRMSTILAGLQVKI